MNLSGNTILITGGTSGLGQAFAEEFFKQGNTVIICGRRGDRLEQLKTAHPGLITRVCDISDEIQRKELCEWALQTYPRLNVLINNAGMQLAMDLTKPVDNKLIREELETNLVAYIHLASMLAGDLKTKTEAAIINVSSGLAFVPLAFMPVYCASKAAVHSVTLSLRHQLKNTSVKVYEIIPPSTDTELGHQQRTDKAQSHGGIPVSEFLHAAIEGLKNDVQEIAVGQSVGLREKREEMFNVLNR